MCSAEFLPEQTKILRIQSLGGIKGTGESMTIIMNLEDEKGAIVQREFSLFEIPILSLYRPEILEELQVVEIRCDGHISCEFQPIPPTK